MPERMHELQQFLRDTGRDPGAIDGIYGPKTREAILYGMEDGPDTALVLQDYRNAAARLGCHTAAILALAEVEAAGAGFLAGKPKLLFEPHVFSRLTKGRFDASHPIISYPKWGARRYVKDHNERYLQLLEAIGLDPWAGFSSASYGKFQIMGFNHAQCGFVNPWAFAINMAYDEKAQIAAFEKFIVASGIVVPLRGQMWAQVARKYNGPGYAANRYDVKLAQSARAWERKLLA